MNTTEQLLKLNCIELNGSLAWSLLFKFLALQHWRQTLKQEEKHAYHCFTLQFWNLARVKYKHVIFRHLVDMWFIHLGLRGR